MLQTVRCCAPLRTAHCLRTTRTSRLVAVQPSQTIRIQRRHKYTIEVNRKSTGTGTRSQQIRQAYRDSPFAFSLAVVCITVAVASLIYANYNYVVRLWRPFHKFPEPVANKMRRALYYTNQAPDPKKALKYYKEALQVAEECQMDPFSDEVIGMKIQIAAFLEQNWHHETAARVLDRLLRDLENWVKQEGPNHITDGRRSAILGKTVGIGVKLGELYTHPNLKDTEAAETALVGAVETVLKEKQRREREGVKEGEGQWMSDQEIGGALEALGDHYQSQNSYYLATPLFLQALNHCPNPSCHAAVLMNNLATSIAEQKITSTTTKASATAPDLLEQASLWAKKAGAHTKIVPAEEQTEECKLASITALFNLGEFAERQKNESGAAERYKEALAAATLAGLEEGRQKAMEALKRLGSS